MTSLYMDGGFFKAPKDGGGSLITRYTHTANTVIQPTALDVATGVFTVSTAHGLSVGDTIYVNFNEWASGFLPITKVPYELFAKGGATNVAECTHIINSTPTSTTFTLRNTTNTDIVYNGNGSVNSAIDMTAFHFEKLVSFSLTNINKPNVLLRIKGISPVGYGGILVNNNETRLSFINGLNFVTAEVRYTSVFNMLQAHMTYAGTGIRSAPSTANYNLTIAVAQSPANTMNVTNGFISKLINVDTITGNSVRSTWLNGSSFELYDLG